MEQMSLFDYFEEQSTTTTTVKNQTTVHKEPFSEGLTADQKAVFDKMVAGENLFLTGNAGTGKSFVLNRFSEYCDATRTTLMKCAPTGIASQNIGGATLHRQFKAPIGVITNSPSMPPPELIKTDVLLIDEISMARIDLFDWVMKDVDMANEQRRTEGRNLSNSYFVETSFSCPLSW